MVNLHVNFLAEVSYIKVPMTRKIRYFDYCFIGKIFYDDRITPFTVFFSYLSYSLRDTEIGVICKLFKKYRVSQKKRQPPLEIHLLYVII